MVLDGLRLVADHDVPGVRRHGLDVSGDRAVGGDHQIDVVELLGQGCALLAVGAVGDENPKLRAEGGRFGFPVVHDRQWAQDQARPSGHVADEMGQRGRRLPQSHVVGQAAPEAEPSQERQPADGSTLIGPKPADESLGLVGLGQPIIGQPGQQIGQPPVGRRAALLVTVLVLVLVLVAEGEELDRLAGRASGRVVGGGRQPQELGRGHGGVLAALGQVLEGAGDVSGVDPYPCATESHQR